MSKEKLAKLIRYSEDLKNRLSSPVPEKHVRHPETYKRFLEREIATTSAKIDDLKLVSDGAAIGAKK